MNSLNRDGEKKLSKEDLAFWESVKDLPPLERAMRCSLRWGTGFCQTNTPKDQWKEVDDKLQGLLNKFLQGYAETKWRPNGEDIEALFHSELEKVRQEAEDNMRKRCLEALPKVIDIDDQTNYRESAYEDGVDDGFNKALYEVKQALLSLPDQERLSNTKTE